MNRTGNSTEIVDKEALIAALFEFAAEGEPLALIKPLLSLLGTSDDDGCKSLFTS